VIDGVHGNTTSLGPRVALDSELVLGTRSLCREMLAFCTSYRLVSANSSKFRVQGTY
jgi:hypothetical protein